MKAVSAPNTQNTFGRHHLREISRRSATSVALDRVPQDLRVQSSCKKYLYYVRLSPALLADRTSLPPSSSAIPFQVDHFDSRFLGLTSTGEQSLRQADRERIRGKGKNAAKTRGGRDRREETDEDGRGVKAGDVVKAVRSGFRVPEDTSGSR